MWNEIGDSINHFFESQACWFYDNGMIYFSGRDIGWFIIGFLVCWVCFAIGECYGLKRRR